MIWLDSEMCTQSSITLRTAPHLHPNIICPFPTLTTQLTSTAPIDSCGLERSCPQRPGRHHSLWAKFQQASLPFVGPTSSRSWVFLPGTSGAWTNFWEFLVCIKKLGDSRRNPKSLQNSNSRWCEMQKKLLRWKCSKIWFGCCGYTPCSLRGKPKIAWKKKGPQRGHSWILSFHCFHYGEWIWMVPSISSKPWWCWEPVTMANSVIISTISKANQPIYWLSFPTEIFSGCDKILRWDQASSIVKGAHC